ncbi:glycosyltransferase family 4 protein [uncultured Flavobacterium sp.]|mgnify:CR=1 FL=1|uniref:glycosyltransferase family 4 protein n=1 Tax=uncultured Flavobacterium sp. TaxID=165435 RepID=UPI0025F52C16|nr:glycosyltransferase family 4 protein [uncultured Flavobacterium sp.]
MKVLFQSRINLYTALGGDTVQMEKTKKYLEKLGVVVDISLEAEPDLTDYDLVHLFNLMEPQDIYIQMLNAKKQNKIVVLSTIYGLYTEFERKERGGLFQKIANVTSPYQIGYIKAFVKAMAGGNIHKGVRKMLFKGYYAMMKEVIDNTSVFLPNSHSEMKRVAKEFKIENPRYVSIPNAVDKEVFKFDDKPLKYSEYKGCILCAARIEGRKGSLKLVKAMKDLPYTLVLVGKESSNQKEFVEQVHKEAGDNVVFLGPVSHEDLRDLYAQARVHALTSWMETPGLSSLEAAVMNCNIVATKKGDAYDYLGDYAHYCDPADPESIKTAIEKAYKSEIDSKLREVVLDNYTWEKTANATLEAYKMALGK